jgi:transcriptional regulator with XRE-family HTH domain
VARVTVVNMGIPVRERRTCELIRMAREARGLTAVDVIRMASMGAATYWRWEHGYVVPNAVKLDRLCLLLGLPLGALSGSDVGRARRVGRAPVKRVRKKKYKDYHKRTGRPVGRPVPPPKAYLSRRALAQRAKRDDGGQEVQS